MKKILQIEGWTLSYTDPADQSCHIIAAQVPGNIIGDLHRAGKIDDPYFGTHSMTLRKYEFFDWEYRAEFDASEIQTGETLQIVFERN